MTARSLSGRPPRGAVIVVVLVCFGLVAVLLASAVRLTVAGRQMAQRQWCEVQAAWLAESGLERAAARLVADPSYAGETWQLTAEQLGLPNPARVEIRVSQAPGHSNRRLTHVQADYPDDPLHRSRHSRDELIPCAEGVRP